MKPRQRDPKLTAEPGEDAFLRELAELERGTRETETHTETAALGLDVLSEALPAIAPRTALRAQLMAAIPSSGRFERFASSVAELLDIGLDRARALLDRLDDPSAWSNELPGISFFWVEGGPRVADAVRGFLRVQAGSDFPVHEHIGDEVVLVLQGSFEDPGRGAVFRPGDIDRQAPGTSHDYRVPKDGPDLLQLAVVHTGVRALGQTWLPR